MVYILHIYDTRYQLVVYAHLAIYLEKEQQEDDTNGIIFKFQISTFVTHHFWPFIGVITSTYYTTSTCNTILYHSIYILIWYSGIYTSIYIYIYTSTGIINLYITIREHKPTNITLNNKTPLPGATTLSFVVLDPSSSICQQQKDRHNVST